MIKGITKSKNLFDVSKLSEGTAGKYLSSNGAETDNGAWTITPFIPVNGDYVTLYGPVGNSPSICAYDENLQFVRGEAYQNHATNTISIQGASYVRFSLAPASQAHLDAMLNYGQTPLPYEPYGDIPKDITRIAMKGKQLIPEIVQGGVTSSTGAFVESSSRLRSGYISVKPGTTYSLDAGNLYAATGAFYKDGAYVSAAYGDTTKRLTFTVPDNANQVVVSFRPYNSTDIITPSDISGYMLNDGSSPLPYEPYGMQPGWEVRDQQGTILWAADKTLTGTDSIPIKGYGLPLTDYKVEADMTVPATQEYSIEGTSSIDYQSNGSALTDLEFQGNMVQSGTPSSSSPIYPSEMGERTGNLVRVASDNYIAYSTYTDFTIVGDMVVTSGNVLTGFLTKVEPNTDYAVAFDDTSGYAHLRIRTYSEKPTSWSDASYIDQPVNVQGSSTHKSDTFTTTSETEWVLVCMYVPSTAGGTVISNIMLNLGSSPLPYEPYGYKIPFSNGQTSYNVYLTEPLRKIGDYADRAGMVLGGKRKIKKLVLTGTEEWIISAGWKKTATSVFYMALADIIHISAENAIFVYSNAFAAATRNELYNGDSDMVARTGTEALTIRVSDNIATTVPDFKAFLSTQYSAGTPVTVWYVLATEQSDPVTFPTVTPAQGANTLSVSTTLAPSKTRLTATSGVWPKNPIWPAEFGERTGNLFDLSSWTNTNTDTKSFFQLSITLYSGSTSFGERRLDINENGHFSLTSATAGADGATRLAIKHNGSARDLAIGNVYGSFPANQPLTISFDVTGHDPTTSGGISISNIMVNEGSTALPYEPYGQFKIPITCGGNTYNVFTTAPLRKIGSYADYEQLSVGEGRKIVKLVLDGTENWSNLGGNAPYSVPLSSTGKYDGSSIVTWACSHYKAVPNNASWAAYDSCVSVSAAQTISGTMVGIRFRDTYCADLTAFKAYLAQEYAAGHPVTIWYVLATEQTTPTQLPIITPTDGNDTFAVNTTVPPSAVTITGHVKQTS